MKENNSEGNVLLRTLTMKSKIGFGNHKFLTVEEMFTCELGHELIDIYYKLEKVSFTKDILDKLFISPINKPGKDKLACSEARKKYWEEIKKEKTKEEIIKLATHAKAARNSNSKAIYISSLVNQRKFDKQSLAWKNQGH